MALVGIEVGLANATGFTKGLGERTVCVSEYEIERARERERKRYMNIRTHTQTHTHTHIHTHTLTYTHTHPMGVSRLSVVWPPFLATSVRMTYM